MPQKPYRFPPGGNAYSQPIGYTNMQNLTVPPQLPQSQPVASPPIHDLSHIRNFFDKPRLRCPFTLDPEGRPALDEDCWQCRLRNLIDNKIFFWIYIFSLVLLSQFTSLFTTLASVFFIVIVTFLSYTCSFSGNLFITATKGLLISSGVTLLASYFVFAIVRLF